MLADNVLENVPNNRFLGFDELLGLLDGGAVPGGFELVIDERLKELKSHLLRQAALVQLEFRADDDDRAAGVVDALTEQVLAEAALLTLEGVRERLQWAVVGAAQHATATAVIEERIDCFLEHALLVANDHVGRVKLHELLQPIIAVDDAAIQVVQVGSGEAAAIQRHHGAQLGRQNRDYIENHPLGLVAALAKRFEDLEALGELDALLKAGIDLHFFAQLFAKLLDVDAAQELLAGFGAHASVEFAGEFALQLAELFFLQNFLLLDARDFSWIDDHESLAVKNVFEVAHGEVEKIADAAGQALEEPDVRAGRSQLDMAEALTADFAQSDFYAALIANDSAVLHALVFAAQTLPVGDRAKDLGAEEAVALRLEGTVVDGFRLGYFAMRPGPDFFRTRQRDANGIEIRDLTGTIIWARTIQCLTSSPEFRAMKLSIPFRTSETTYCFKVCRLGVALAAITAEAPC